MLHGRDAECVLVAELLDAARRSESRVLIIRGEPGAGKTALLADARARADGMRVLAARGVASESELPYAALHQLLGPILDRLPEIPAPQGRALGRALGLSDDGGSERFLVFAGCLSLLAAAAEDGPLLCLIDDAHWLDAASADALLFVARRLGAEGIAILAGTRTAERGGLDGTGLPSVTLGGLDLAAAASLLEGAGLPVAAAVREQLVEQTGGNPLALLELPRGLTAGQLAGTEPLPEALPLSERVESAFLTRVLVLPEAAQRLLLVAATDDSEHLSTILRAAAEFGAADHELTLIEEAGLLRVVSARVEFRHPVLRSAVYGHAPSAQRREVHRALAAHSDSDRRAWHLAAATVEPDEEVVAALEATAARAEARAGHLAAARAFERAAELSANPADRGRRLAAAACAASLAGRDDRAVALADQALPLLGDSHLLGELARVRAEAIVIHGRPADAVPLLLDAARVTADPTQALDLLVSATRAGVEAGIPAVIAEATELAEAIRPDDEKSSCMRDLLTGQGAMWAGDTERGAQLLGHAIAWTERSDEPRFLAWGSRGALFLGQHDRAAELLDRCAALARERGEVSALATALGLRAFQLLWVNRFDDAGVAASEAAAIARELGATNLIPVPVGVLAWVAAIRGQDDAVAKHVAEVQGIAGPHGLAPPASLAVYAQATLDLGRGRYQRAVDQLMALTEMRPGFGTPVVAIASAPERVEACVRAGRAEDARATLADFERWATHAGPAWAGPSVAVCRALVDDDDDAWKAAIALSADARPLDAARARLYYGEHLRRNRRRADARTELRLAIEGFEAFGATPWADRATAELRATGETARKRDSASLSQLTPQELQVAQLVGEGMSNKEVAAHLYLSPRTIDAHLRNVFAKLGITRRTQLAHLPLNLGDFANAGVLTPA